MSEDTGLALGEPAGDAAPLTEPREFFRRLFQSNFLGALPPPDLHAPVGELDLRKPEDIQRLWSLLRAKVNADGAYMRYIAATVLQNHLQLVYPEHAEVIGEEAAAAAQELDGVCREAARGKSFAEILDLYR